MQRLLVITTAIALLTACSTHRGTVMSDVAQIRAEPHGMWSRPLELGYEVVGDVQGEAESQRLLGIKLGAETTGGVGIGIFGLIGKLAGGKKAADPIVQTAAYNAVVSSGADAIYITRWEVKKQGLPPIFETKQAIVHGKALRLVDYGPVDQQRVDQDRMGVPFDLVIEADQSALPKPAPKATPAPPPPPPPPAPPAGSDEE